MNEEGNILKEWIFIFCVKTFYKNGEDEYKKEKVFDLNHENKKPSLLKRDGLTIIC